MKINTQNPPKYLKQTTTGRIYAYSPFKANRADMEPYEMPVNVPVAKGEGKMVGDQPAGDDATKLEPHERLAKIMAAIAAIPVEDYGVATMGRPALPKVADVSELAGFKVGVDEILSALGNKVE